MIGESALKLMEALTSFGVCVVYKEVVLLSGGDVEMENNNNGTGKGVRKGAWTSEEDILLRDCIHKFGEGKWHLVPLRAGLNRCRKSCRLRWLNYLRPNLKRGYFGKDEVDLIVRLHKLLGNRWSLIAGRLPGRTANDVKNFWNTHINSKKPSSSISSSTSTSDVARITHSNIVRPRPRTFSNLQPIKHDHSQLIIPSSSSTSPSPSPAPLKGDHNINPSPDLDDECIRWWGNLLHMTDTQQTDSTFPFPDHHPPITDSMFLQDHGIIPHQLCHTFSLPADHSPLEHYLFTTD